MSHWIQLKIEEKKYFLLCKINEENECDSLLYDGNESWHEKRTVDVILKRAKEQNKRIQFDEDTIKITLQSAQPTEAIWLAENFEDENNEDDAGKQSLKLKYHVQSCPLNFTWHFNKQTEHDFQKFILFPLFRIVQGLTKQNNELREIVRKKDIEIKQYKYEGAVLKRVTVSTQPFDFVNFDEKHAETLELSKCMDQISDLLKAQYTQMKTPLKSKVYKEGETVKTNGKEDLKLTPRRKRRKLIETRQKIIEEKLKACNKPFAYDSSQSQISSISQSDTEKPSTSRRLLRSPRKKEEFKIENDLNEGKSTPTKQSSPQKPNQDNSPVKLVKRNLNGGIQYDTSSEEEKERTPNVKPTQTVKQSSSTKEVDKVEVNSAPLTRTNATVNKSLKRGTATAPLNSAKRNAGINYEDSSESSTEEKPEKKSNLTVPTTPIKKSEQNVIQSPEQLTADVQNLIDEWKALEKRRLADLKTE